MVAGHHAGCICAYALTGKVLSATLASSCHHALGLMMPKDAEPHLSACSKLSCMAASAGPESADRQGLMALASKGATPLPAASCDSTACKQPIAALRVVAL